MVSDILPKVLRWPVLREERPGEISKWLEFPESETEKVEGCGRDSRGSTILSQKREKKSEEKRAVRGDYRCGVAELSGDVGHAAVNGSTFLAHNLLCAPPLALVPFLLHYLSEMLQVSPRLDIAKVRRH